MAATRARRARERTYPEQFCRCYDTKNVQNVILALKVPKRQLNEKTYYQHKTPYSTGAFTSFWISILLTVIFGYK